MGKKTFLIEADKCTGCSLCIVACKDEHVGTGYAPWTEPQPDTGQFWIDVRRLERGRIPRVRMSFLPVHCQNCENAPCIKVCPDDAIKTRDDGLVWIDPAACTGCGLCPDACPYDVIFMNDEGGIAQKCTGCAHRVDDGDLPRCAEVCPHDAIVFGDQTEISAKGDDGGGPLEAFHPEFRAEPLVLWRGLPKPWIAGTVVDAASDDVVSDATIAAVDLFEDDTASTASDAFGDFWLNGMKSGRKYRIEITKAGYQNHVAIVTADGDQDLGTVRLDPKR